MFGVCLYILIRSFEGLLGARQRSAGCSNGYGTLLAAQTDLILPPKTGFIESRFHGMDAAADRSFSDVPAPWSFVLERAVP